MRNEFPFPTRSVTVDGESVAAGVVAALVGRSQWFEVAPLPDDFWRITVKRENTGMLDEIVGASYHPATA